MLAYSSKKILFTFLVLCITPILPFAQGKNFSINRADPSWIIKIKSDGEKVKAKDVSDGYYYSLLEEQNHVELHETYKHVIRQIISEAGVQNGSQISVTYDPSFQKLIFHKVTVWRDNQPYDQLSKTQFKVLQNEKNLSKFIYSGTFDAYLLLDDIRKGDRIEYAYTIKGNNPVWGNKYTDEFYFEGNYRNGHMYTNFIVSKDRKLSFRNFNFDGQPKISDKDGLQLYEWENSLTNTYITAKYEPSWYNPFKRTQVSEYKSWDEIVNWGLKVNSYEGLKTPAVDQLVADLQSKSKHDPVTYMELATRFVQDEIRYMGIEMGAYSQRPNSPEKVLKQRYGDCKDKSLLLVYLLNKANITAHMAYIDTYAGEKLTDFLPSPFLFDHVVVVVEHNKQKTWIDPTISLQRGPFKKHYFPDYGYALVLKPGVKSPEKVISLATGKLVANLIFKVASDTIGSKKTTLVIKSTYTDNYADNIRSEIADEGSDGLEKSFLDYIKNYYPDIEASSDIKITDNEKDNIIELTESYLISDFWENTKGEPILAKFHADLISTNLRDINLKHRTEPLTLKSPMNVEQHISIHLPFKSGMNNESENIQNDYFSFQFNAAQHGHEVTLDYTYKGLKGYVPEKDLKVFMKDTETINSMLAYHIYFDNQSIGGDLNSYLILIAILTLIISGFFFLRIYQQQMEFYLEEMANARPIGGFLLLFGIALTGGLFSLPFRLINTGIFTSSLWDSAGDLDSYSSLFIYAVSIIEIISYSFQYCWLILIIFLFFNRREILPGEYIKYIIFATALGIFDLLTSSAIGNILNKPYFNELELGKILLRVIFCILWVYYFKRSDRVRETFVFTYPQSSWKNDLKEHKKN